MGTKRILDYDPLSGLTCSFEYDHATNRVIISHEADVERNLRHSAALRQDEDYTRRGIRNDMWHYARLEPAVQLRMLQEDGVDIHNKDHRKKMFELLNTKYAAFKTTYKTHNVKSGY